MNQFVGLLIGAPLVVYCAGTPTSSDERTAVASGGPIRISVECPIQKYGVSHPLPMTLEVQNMTQDTIYFIDFGDSRNCEPYPVVTFRGETSVFRCCLPLSKGSPAPLPTKKTKGKGAFSIVKLPPSCKYRVRFDNVFLPEEKMTNEQKDGLQGPFTVEYRWTKAIWHTSEVWPFGREELFLPTETIRPASFVVTFEEDKGRDEKKTIMQNE